MATPKQIKRRGRLSLILGASIAAALFVAVSWADVISNNDVVTGGDTSLARGASSQANIFIAAPTGAPDAPGCNATGADPATAAVVLTVGGTSSEAKPLVGCGSTNFADVAYSVETTAVLASLITVTSNVSGGKPGSVYTQDSFTVRVLPRAASGLSATASGANAINLSWTASPDAADITDYKIYEGATEVASAAKNAATTSITGLAPGSSHCYTIKARYNNGTNDYFSAAVGGSGAACATTASDSTPPVITKTITGTAGTGGWYRSDVTVEWSVTDLDSTVVIDSGCGTQNFTSETAGTASSCEAHSAGGSSSDSVTIKIDKTKPVISATATKADATTYVADTWTNQSVTVSFSCADDAGPANSGLASDTVGGGGTQVAETATGSFTNTGGCTDNAGNSAVSNTFSPIKIDKTKPLIGKSATANGLAYTSGTWTKYDVVVTFTCADTGGVQSGIATNTVAGDTLTTEGDNQSVTNSGSCVDNAGNPADSETFSGIRIDKTPPGLAWNSGINDGDSFYFGFVPAAPTCTASDSLSGPDGCNVTGYSTAVGAHTLTATAKDKAGNQKAETRDYTVLAWTLNGFYAPVDMTPPASAPVWNSVKNGSTVPLKFEVFAGPTELTDTSIVNQPLKATQTPCLGGTTDEVELTASGGTSLRYDTTAGQFIYNWQTPKKMGYCYVVTVTTLDGSSLSAYFKLR